MDEYERMEMDGNNWMETTGWRYIDGWRLMDGYGCVEIDGLIYMYR